MENSKFWVLALRFVLGLCALSVALEPKILAVAKDFAAVYDNGEVVDIDRADDVNGGRGSEIGGVFGGSDACGNDLSSFLPLPYSNISKMACHPIWNTFILRYHHSEENVMTIILSAIYTTGWVGIGFSRDGMMAGSSAMVGWINKEGKARIKQYYLQGTVPSQVLPDKGELPLNNMPAVVVLHGATIFLAFQMKFETPVTLQPLILAFGTAYPHHSRLTRHDDKTAIVFDFSARSGSHVNKNTDTGFEQMKKNHGILGVIGWGLILPIGAIVPRYFKHKDPLWFYLHTIVQFVGFIIGLATVVVGTQLYNTVHVPTHRGIGIFVLVLSILQILAFFLRPNKDAKIRKFWNWYHHWFGRFALFFGALNIVVGIQVGGAGSEWKIGYGFLVGIILVAVIVLEILSLMKRSEKPPPDSTFQMNPI